MYKRPKEEIYKFDMMIKVLTNDQMWCQNSIEFLQWQTETRAHEREEEKEGDEVN